MKKLILGIVMILFTCSIQAANYYWTGGTGNWSDFANHWATASGGTTFYTQPPTPLDDVYFDANSFSANGQAVTVDQPANFCKNFILQNTISGSDLVTTDTLYQIRVFGSFFSVRNYPILEQFLLKL